MQIIVLGMHRSGTSTVSRLLNLMGIYFGPEGISTGANDENKKGFWERKDVRQLNDFILQSNNLDWYKIANYDGPKNFSDSTKVDFEKRAKRIILDMDAFRPWFIKEPRICLNLELWKKNLEVPIAVFVYRNPLEVAKSLQLRNGFPIEYGLALWEKYNLFALSQAKGIPLHFIDYNSLVEDPESIINGLSEYLLFQNVQTRKLSNKELLAFIDPSLYRQKADSQYKDYLTGSQTDLYTRLLKNQPWKVKKADFAGIDTSKLKNYESIFQRGFEFKEIESQYGNLENENKLIENKLSSNYELVEKQKKRIVELEQHGRDQNEAIKRRDNQISIFDKKLKDIDLKLIIKEEDIRKSKDNFREKDDEIRKKEDEIRKKEDEIRKKEDEIRKKEDEIRKRDDEITKKQNEIRKRDDEIKKKENEIRKKDDEIKKKEEDIRKKDDEIKKKEEDIRKKDIVIDQQINNIKQSKIEIQELLEKQNELNSSNKRSNEKIVSVEHENKKILDQINSLNTKNNELININDKLKAQETHKDHIIEEYWNQIQKSRITNRIRKILGVNLIGLKPAPYVKETSKITSENNINLENKFQPIGDNQVIAEKVHYEFNTAVIAWDMSHNPVGRSFLFADFMKLAGETKLIGPIFKKYGKGLWSPLSEYNLDYDYFNADVFPNFLREAKSFIQNTEQAEVIIICKPRLPSLILGIIFSALHRTRVILDIDDHELSFFKNRSPITLDELKTLSSIELGEPFSESWTRLSEELVQQFPLIITSNSALKEKFRGEIIPHVRDENKFDPSKYDRTSLRNQYGYQPNDKVILFLGTPRRHKGFVRIYDALKKLNNKNYKLCIVGDIDDQNLKKEILANEDGIIQLHPNSSFNDLPKILSIADLICLLQDQDSPITEYQMPAKVSDALSMAIPLLVTPVKPLLPFIKDGYMEVLLEGEDLATKIDYIFNNYEGYREKAINHRKELFLKTHSYTSAFNTLSGIVENQPYFRTTELLNNVVKELNKKYYKQSQLTNILPEKLNIVFFWKQNDSGIYGRRSDMLIKYMALRNDVNKIICFDSPIASDALLSKKDDSLNSKYFQNQLIYENSHKRMLGKKRGDKIVDYTFVYQKSKAQKNTIEDELKILSTLEEYPKFILNTLKENGVSEENSIFWFCPAIFEFDQIMTVFTPALLVADFIDDQRYWATNDDQKNRIQENYKSFLELSNVTFCNSNEVKESLDSLCGNTKVITNGLEKFTTEEMQSWVRPSELNNLNGPILGYVGNLDPKRLNIDLIKRIAESRKDWNIVLIGSAHMGSENLLQLMEYDNIYLLGVIPYEESVKFIKHFDVGLIPHFDNNLTQSMNPLKLYVYHAMGINIVTSKLNGLDLAHHKNVLVSQSDDEFIENIEKLLLSDNSSSNFEIDDNDTWNYKVDCIIKEIKSKIVLGEHLQ
jgi:glycosyltransferase involved in cell wall biosynthesis